jgi:hypothetical protein
VGQKVSQIQAVLARRCASIGELQQHLWRAGWQQGVAQWGVIGEGTGKWATVVGGDGALENDYPSTSVTTTSSTSTSVASNGKRISVNDNDNNDDSNHPTKSTVDERHEALPQSNTANDETVVLPSSNHLLHHHVVPKKEPVELLPHAAEIGRNSNSNHRDDDDNGTASSLLSSSHGHYYSSHGNGRSAANFVTVARSRGGNIVSHDPAFVAWTVDALRMVRDQVYRAGDGLHELPYYENWPQERAHFNSDINTTNNNNNNKDVDDLDYLPLWATFDAGDDCEDQYVDAKETEEEAAEPADNDKVLLREKKSENNINEEAESAAERPILISNLPLMAREVSELLDAMEDQMQEQRERRVGTSMLRPMSRLRRNWYIGTVIVPVASYVVYKFMKEAKGVDLARRIWCNIREFYAEHVADPVAYVYHQLFETRDIREDVADKMARKQAIESLKIMLKDWLKQRFPGMSNDDRERIVQTMDMTLIEKRKEESVKTALWEINDIVHMSLIEMQFIKKELFNAMVSMDELMQSNEFNFKLAAMTPAFVVVYGVNKMFKFLFYALLKLGKSREQTHEQLRLVVIDMERLLVMRDCPPSAPPPLDWRHGRATSAASKNKNRFGTAGTPSSSSSETQMRSSRSSENVVLSSDDLGMLMLLIHECRAIMLENRQRFSVQEFRSMAEDVAELSGERGPVSVKQQLSIISRMFRTYSFLKVVSSGVSINISRYMERGRQL